MNFNSNNEGNKNLGAVIGTEDYRVQYVTQKLKKLESELVLLSEIAKASQSAYSCFVTELSDENHSQHSRPDERTDDVVSNKFIPAITRDCGER